MACELTHFCLFVANLLSVKMEFQFNLLSGHLLSGKLSITENYALWHYLNPMILLVLT